MNKKVNQLEVRNKRITFRITQSEFKTISGKATEIESKIAEYCRSICINGYIQKPILQYDLNALREFKIVLLEYKTNFSRISNFIKERNPQLDDEIMKIKISLQALIEKIQL